MSAQGATEGKTDLKASGSTHWALSLVLASKIKSSIRKKTKLTAMGSKLLKTGAEGEETTVCRKPNRCLSAKCNGILPIATV